MAKIHRITSGICNCWLIRERGSVLVDTGSLWRAAYLAHRVQGLCGGRGPGLIFLTHGHWDHIAGARALRHATGAPTAIHYSEAEWVERALKPLPPGVDPWGRFMGALNHLILPLIQLKPARVDKPLDDGDRSLEPYGLEGTIFRTPGHSSGSMSLLLAGGDAFVGDLAVNGLPFSIEPGAPIFGDNLDVIRQSWRILLDRGATRIHPAHGAPFPASRLEKLLEKEL